MDRDEYQDMLNILKYNQDRMNKVTKNAEKAIVDLERVHKEFQYEAYDFSDVDSDINKSMTVLKKYGINKSEIKREEYIQTKYKPIVLSDEKEQSFEELVVEANESGYKEIKIEDILTQEEIELADARYQEIENKFAEKTHLRKVDIQFLVLAIALQCIRQYVLTPFDERKSADEVAKRVPQGTGEINGDGIKRYYVPMNEIVSNKKVPYDTIAGSKKYELGGRNKGLSGKTHRYRTLGHDPILGYVFGTANILTNTLTDWKMQSYHIKYMPNVTGIQIPTIAQHADTEKMFDRVKIRFKQDKPAIVAAIAKQYYHIKSDESINGLTIPFLSMASPEMAEELAKKGFDSISLKEVGEQAGYSLLINFIISTIHRLMYDEKKDGKRELYEVRTRKILLYSNLISSISNIIVVGIGAAMGTTGDNPEMVKKSLRYLDVGGLIVTIGRLFSDVRFITKVKEEFIKMELDKDIRDEINEIDNVISEIERKVYA